MDPRLEHFFKLRSEGWSAGYARKKAFNGINWGDIKDISPEDLKYLKSTIRTKGYLSAYAKIITRTPVFAPKDEIETK